MWGRAREGLKGMPMRHSSGEQSVLVSCDVAPVQFFLLARRSSVNPRGRRRGVAVHLFSLRRRRRLLLLRPISNALFMSFAHDGRTDCATAAVSTDDAYSLRLPALPVLSSSSSSILLPTSPKKSIILACSAPSLPLPATSLFPHVPRPPHWPDGRSRAHS